MVHKPEVTAVQVVGGLLWPSEMWGVEGGQSTFVFSRQSSFPMYPRLTWSSETHLPLPPLSPTTCLLDSLKGSVKHKITWSAVHVAKLVLHGSDVLL